MLAICSKGRVLGSGLLRQASASVLSLSPTQQLRMLSTKQHEMKILALNDLTYLEGSRNKKQRWGRGVGSRRGKLSGRGHQKSTATPRGFEGGQTPIYKRLPKIGFNNPNKLELQELNLGRIQEYIDMGRLKVPAAMQNSDGSESAQLITMRDLLASGIISRAKEGIKILAKDKDKLKTPIHLEVTSASKAAIQRVEEIGGTVTCVHFNRLALRALLKPLKFELYPRRARPPPKNMRYYLDSGNCGYLSPEIIQRNLKLFGAVTSEQAMREQHNKYMDFRRVEMREERLRMRKAIEDRYLRHSAEASSSD